VQPGRAADHSPPYSAAVKEEYSYTSTHPLGHGGPVTGTLYLFTGKLQTGSIECSMCECKSFYLDVWVGFSSLHFGEHLPI